MTSPTPTLTDEQIANAAHESGFTSASRAEKIVMWHGSPDALRSFARAILAADGVATPDGGQPK